MDLFGKKYILCKEYQRKDEIQTKTLEQEVSITKHMKF